MKRSLAIAFIFTASCLFLAAQNSAAPTSDNAPIKFRGAYLGQPISDYADCSSGKAKGLAKGYRSHGDVCKGRGLIFHTKLVGGFMNSKDAGEILQFENGSLATIKIKIPNDDWAALRQDLSEKLGEPISEPPQVYQNGFGARWEFNQGFWRRGNVMAYAGVKVLAIDACGGPCQEGIEIVIKAASPISPNSLD